MRSCGWHGSAPFCLDGECPAGHELMEEASNSLEASYDGFGNNCLGEALKKSYCCEGVPTTTPSVKPSSSESLNEESTATF